ncbi:MAG: zinc-dependent peptidase [Flavobacteriaceae bacterium]
MKYLYAIRYALHSIGILELVILLIESFTLYFFNSSAFTHFYIRKKKLSIQQKKILEENILFYQRLDAKHQECFEHRLATFIRNYKFIGRDKLVITSGTRVMIGASYVMLTFGNRRYMTDVFNKIIVYPDIFLSQVNQRKHKGEFNPKYKVVVFSWKHFLEGNAIKDDNLNLGIHEFTHILHVNSIKNRDVHSLVFRRGYRELINYIQENKAVKKELIASAYFREYAFENQYEFMAVLLENFIETPKEFKSKFPRIYRRIKKMLNFNFLDY